jgi:hypothetical protein
MPDEDRINELGVRHEAGERPRVAVDAGALDRGRSAVAGHVPSHRAMIVAEAFQLAREQPSAPADPVQEQDRPSVGDTGREIGDATVGRGPRLDLGHGRSPSPWAEATIAAADRMKRTFQA